MPDAHLPWHRLAGPQLAWRRFVWDHPEWWCLALSAAAWVVLLLPASPAGGTASPVIARHAHHTDAVTLPLPDVATDTLNWVLMVIAMMVPFLVGAIRTTAARSLWRRRHRAIACFLAGYLGPWLLAGVGIAVVAVVLTAALGSPALSLAHGLESAVLAAAGFLIAAAWQLAPAKRRALRACHRTTPLAPHGWRADRDCARYGALIGLRCVVSCWALMLACLLTGHGVLAMIAATLVGVAERSVERPDLRLTSGALCGLASAYIAIYTAAAFH